MARITCEASSLRSSTTRQWHLFIRWFYFHAPALTRVARMNLRSNYYCRCCVAVVVREKTIVSLPQSCDVSDCHCRAPQDGESHLQNNRAVAEYQARKNAINIASAIFRAATDLLHRAHSSPGGWGRICYGHLMTRHHLVLCRFSHFKVSISLLCSCLCYPTPSLIHSFFPSCFSFLPSCFTLHIPWF